MIMLNKLQISKALKQAFTNKQEWIVGDNLYPPYDLASCNILTFDVPLYKIINFAGKELKVIWIRSLSEFEIIDNFHNCEITNLDYFCIEDFRSGEQLINEYLSKDELDSLLSNSDFALVPQRPSDINKIASFLEEIQRAKPLFYNNIEKFYEKYCV